MALVVPLPWATVLRVLVSGIRVMVMSAFDPYEKLFIGVENCQSMTELIIEAFVN
jgi:hypothetical protein